jgi:hypothetical protein
LSEWLGGIRRLRLKRELKEDLRNSCLDAASGPVQPHSRNVCAVGENPSGSAIEFAADAEHSVEHDTPDTAALMRWRDANLVEPKLGRLVGIDIVKRRDEADDLTGVDGNHKVMTRIVEERCDKLRVGCAIEDAGCDGVKNRGIARSKDATFNFHA